MQSSCLQVLISFSQWTIFKDRFFTTITYLISSPDDFTHEGDCIWKFIWSFILFHPDLDGLSIHSVAIFWRLLHGVYHTLTKNVWTWQWVYCNQTSTVIRSQSYRAPLGCGRTGDSHHVQLTDLQLGMLSCQHGTKSPRNVLSTLLILHHKDLRQQKRESSDISKV